MAGITLKKIPRSLHKALRESARQNRRSLNSEIISRLEGSVAARRVDVEKLIERAQRLRQSVRIHTTAEEIDRAKRQGRR